MTIKDTLCQTYILADHLDGLLGLIIMRAPYSKCFVCLPSMLLLVYFEE